MAQAPLLILIALTLFVASILKAETWTVVGEEAELIMKYGTISNTKCENIDEMQYCPTKPRNFIQVLA